MNIKIERGVPLPTKAGGRNPEIIASIKKMKIGDSFKFDGKSQSNVYVYAKMAGIKVTMRLQPGGMRRVWRVA